MAAGYNHRRRELHDRILTDPDEVRIFLGEVSRMTRSNVEWNDDEIDAMFGIARRFFTHGDDKVQTITFDFITKLIDTFELERSLILNRERTSFVRSLLNFFFSVALRRSIKPALFTKASSRAEAHVRDGHHHQSIALQAFEMSWFAEYPVERFEKKAVKNLLKIAKAKMFRDDGTDPLMPGTICFIDNVCCEPCSCSVVIHVCDILTGLFRSLHSRQALQELSILEAVPTFRFIMGHEHPPSSRKKCWEAVARFFRETFLHADTPTKGILVSEGVFSRIYGMLSDSRKNIVFELLETVEIVARDRLFVNRLVTEKIILRILEMIGASPGSSNVRSKLCLTFCRFLAFAPNYEVYRAAENGALTLLGSLLKSKFETPDFNALNWIQFMFEDCQQEPMRKGFVELVRKVGIEATLERRSRHRRPAISNPAQDFLRRLRAPRIVPEKRVENETEEESEHSSVLSSIDSWATASSWPQS